MKILIFLNITNMIVIMKKVGLFFEAVDTVEEQTVFGMSRAVFFVVVIASLLILLALFYLYLSIVFVDANTVKIVERNGKFKKTISSGFSFIVPVIDKVVASIPTTKQTYHSKSFFEVQSLNGKVINYSIVYKVIDFPRYYYSSANINDFIDATFTKNLYQFFGKVKEFDFSLSKKIDEEKVLNSLSSCSRNAGIEVQSITFLVNKNK